MTALLSSLRNLKAVLLNAGCEGLGLTLVVKKFSEVLLKLCVFLSIRGHVRRGPKLWPRPGKPKPKRWQVCKLVRKNGDFSKSPVFSVTFRAATQESQVDSYPDTSEKYRDTPPNSIVILLQKYVLLLQEIVLYTTNLSHDAVLIGIAILLRKGKGQGLMKHP